MSILNYLEGAGSSGPRFSSADRELNHLLGNRPRQRTPATTFGPATPVRYEDLVRQLQRKVVPRLEKPGRTDGGSPSPAQVTIAKKKRASAKMVSKGRKRKKSSKK